MAACCPGLFCDANPGKTDSLERYSGKSGGTWWRSFKFYEEPVSGQENLRFRDVSAQGQQTGIKHHLSVSDMGFLNTTQAIDCLYVGQFDGTLNVLFQINSC